MDLTQLLAASQVTDNNIRQNAEAHLRQLESQNISLFMVSLVDELSNEQKPPETRALAGIMLKNSIHAPSNARLEELQGRWVNNIDMQTKEHVKKKVLETLGSPITTVVTTASVLIAKISDIELKRNQWPSLIPTLSNTSLPEQFQSVYIYIFIIYKIILIKKFKKKNHKYIYIKKVALETLGYICEDVSPNDLRPYASPILTAVIFGMRIESQLPVRLAATKTLFHVLEFIYDNMELEHERNVIVKNIVDAAVAADVSIRTAAFECLVQVANLYYEKVEDYMTTIWELTSRAIANDVDAVGREAVEFWCTLCECEIEIQQSGGPNKFFMKRVLPYLTDVLFLGCTKQEEDFDESSFNVAMACGECLKLMALCAKNDVVDIYMSKVNEFVGHENWRFREAAALTFGSALEGPEPESIRKYVQRGLSLFVQMAMTDRSIAVRDTAAWALKRVCEFHYDAQTISVAYFYSDFMNALVSGLKQK
jgi:importin subunit beta-1